MEVSEINCKFRVGANRYFQDNCRFEHPGVAPRDFSNANRFAPLQHSDNSRNSNSNGYRSGRRDPADQRVNITDNFKASSTLVGPPYALDKAAIVADLSTEKPQWILSAYGPGRGVPAQLFGGPLREQSFEELRLLHYMGLASGNPQQAVQEADKIYQAAEQQIQTALNDVDGAINYIIKAENEHPNRIDIVRESQATSAGSQRGVFSHAEGSNSLAPPYQPAAAPGFGAPAQPGTFGKQSGGDFGQPSALGQRPNPFGAPSGAFGQPTGGGAFGQPSALGQKPNPSGAPAPAFGTTTQLGGGGAFGQHSALGQKPNPFGEPSGAFGQPSTLGQKPNPFGGQQAAPVPFGATPPATQTNPFGAPSGQSQNLFGAQNLSAQPNPFGASSAPFGAPSPAPKNPFAAASQTTSSPFGATPATAPSNPFGSPQPTSQQAPNPFGNPQTISQPAANPFGQQPTPHPAANPLAQGPLNAPQPLSASPFGAPPSQSSTNGFSAIGTEHPRVSSYSTSDVSGRLLTFKGKRVVYKDSEPGTQNFDGSWQKIWFPDGPPPYNKWAEAEPEKYTEEVKTAYENARRNGVFDGGVIPLVPPKQAWCQWDF